jgi:hypothetical protein
MKQAHFTWKDPRNDRRMIFGTVTQKRDGKISVSLHDARRYCAADRYSAKALANKIVESGFKHDSITHLVSSTSNEKLITDLTHKTQGLRHAYITKVKEYTKEAFEYAVKRTKWTEKEWFNEYKIEYVEKPSLYKPGTLVIEPLSKEYNGKRYYKMRSEQRNVKDIVAAGYQKLEDKEVMFAERHYADSVEKLAQRLHDKGLTEGQSFEITSGWVGVNFNIIIKHGDEVTKAWTIVASGPIQRPHYRYLVK